MDEYSSSSWNSGRLEHAAKKYTSQNNEDNLGSLLQASTGLIYHYVRIYSGGVSIKEDLIQVGYEGVIKAAKNFAPSRNVTFCTYASHYIKGEIRRELMREASFDRPRWLFELQNKIKRETEQLTQNLGREPSLAEIADAVNVREEGIVQALLAGKVSLDEIDVTRIKNVHYESFQLPIEDRILIRQALEKLTELQKNIVYLTFFKDMTQIKTAEVLGINQKRVSRLLKSALDKMKIVLDIG